MEGGDRVGGVQRREHEVSRQRGLHRDASRLDVSDLSDEDHIRVLSQDGAKPGGEGQARLLIRLDLVDGRKDVLDRVLDRHHVAGVIADLGEGRVERRRLAAAGRARTEHHAERGPDEVRVGLGRFRGHSQLTQAEDRSRPVEKPHDALLTPDGGDGGHPDVDLFPVDLRAQLAVLRPTSFDDVHAGHDLDAADQADSHGGGECQDLLECAVDPVANPDSELGRFDVDVGRAVTHGLGEDAAHHLDDRRILGHDVRRQRASSRSSVVGCPRWPRRPGRGDRGRRSPGSCFRSHGAPRTEGPASDGSASRLSRSGAR